MVLEKKFKTSSVFWGPPSRAYMIVVRPDSIPKQPEKEKRTSVEMDLNQSKRRKYVEEIEFVLL